MYSYELDEFIKLRNHSLTPTEYIFATDIRQHSQINHIKLISDMSYAIWTDDGYSWEVTISNIG